VHKRGAYAGLGGSLSQPAGALECILPQGQESAGQDANMLSALASILSLGDWPVVSSLFRYAVNPSSDARGPHGHFEATISAAI
jgi:hypothetical protein